MLELISWDIMKSGLPGSPSTQKTPHCLNLFLVWPSSGWVALRIMVEKSRMQRKKWLLSGCSSPTDVRVSSQIQQKTTALDASLCSVDWPWHPWRCKTAYGLQTSVWHVWKDQVLNSRIKHTPPKIIEESINNIFKTLSNGICHLFVYNVLFISLFE